MSDKQKDDMPLWVAIPILAVSMAIYVAYNDPEKWQELQSWIRWGVDTWHYLGTASPMSASSTANTIATSGSWSVESILVVALAIVGCMVVFRLLGHHMNGQTTKEATAASSKDKTGVPVRNPRNLGKRIKHV